MVVQGERCIKQGEESERVGVVKKEGERACKTAQPVAAAAAAAAAAAVAAAAAEEDF